MASGWKIVCPDGKERHYPYNNRGDAEFDAKTYSSTMVTESGGCAIDDRNREQHGECPGGEHAVEPCVFTRPQPAGSA